METREIMAMIEYRSGFLVPPVEAGEEPPQISCQVVKEDRGRLLVRVEEGVELLSPETPVELDVPTDKALFRLFGVVERSGRTSDGTSIVHLLVEEIETIQRRKQDRFKVNFPLRFIPLREDEKPFEVEHRAHGLGRVIDISLGGLRFETESELPPGLTAQFELWLPNGRIRLIGRIVEGITDPRGIHVYGVKFGRMDTVTSQRMNQLILRFERQSRQSRAGSAGGAALRAGGRTWTRGGALYRRQSRSERRRGR